MTWTLKNPIDGSNHTEYIDYMPRMLDYLWKKTGKVFIAICSGGAALVHPHGRGATYAQLLAAAPDNLDMLVSVICGNDLLASGCHVAAYCQEWDDAAAALCAGMQKKALKQLAVVGGSSACWGYSAWMDDAQQALYNANATRLCEFFVTCGVQCCTGADDLIGLDISDYIGHVDVSSRDIVLDAFAAWASRCEGAAHPVGDCLLSGCVEDSSAGIDAEAAAAGGQVADVSSESFSPSAALIASADKAVNGEAVDMHVHSSVCQLLVFVSGGLDREGLA